MLSVAASPGYLPAAGEPDPLDILVVSINNPTTVEESLTAVLATRDKELLPLLEALSKNGRSEIRGLAVTALPDILDKQAAPLLLDRAMNDPDNLIRGKAIAYLTAMDAISAEQLSSLVKVQDERIQFVSARGLAKKNAQAEAAEVLKRLAESQDLRTAAMAKLSLLAMSYPEYLPQLEELLRDPNTPGPVIDILLQQMAEDKITPAKPLAEIVAIENDDWKLKLAAYDALAASSPQITDRITQAIEDSDRTVFRLGLLRILVNQPGAETAVQSLTSQPGSVGVVASFELARMKQDLPAAADKATEALAMKHPVVIDYMLARIKSDIADKKPNVAAYARPLTQYIQNTAGVDPSKLTSEHFYAARASTLLADIGSPEAFDALRRFINSGQNVTARAASAGLRWSTNPAACDIAAEAVTSDQDEIAINAAIMLGKFADPRGQARLRQVAANGDSQSAALTAMACWYLLKIDGKSLQAAEAMGTQFK